MFDSKVNIRYFRAATYEGIIVHNDDEIILNVNHAFVTMTNYEVREQIGKNSFEVIPSQKLIRKNILSNYEKPDEVVVVKKTVPL
ncbi:adenylate/guanylate cyclase [Tolypothrix sp. NIES-4075]|nr:adenylate/guanylate cyclase [Tolypothrix sp. NIES-4075]